jgi:fucose permease
MEKRWALALIKQNTLPRFTLIAMLVGYILGIFTIPRYVSQQNALKISALLGILFSICIYVSTGYTAITFIALLGLANALMWPAIFPMAIEGLGKFTKIGSAFLVMGIAGGALIPLLYPYLRINQHLPNNLSFFICTIPCYMYILYYSVKGYKVGKATPKLSQPSSAITKNACMLFRITYRH